jgi:hypothetical protein
MPAGNNDSGARRRRSQRPRARSRKPLVFASAAGLATHLTGRLGESAADARQIADLAEGGQYTYTLGRDGRAWTVARIQGWYLLLPHRSTAEGMAP